MAAGRIGYPSLEELRVHSLIKEVTLRWVYDWISVLSGLEGGVRKSQFKLGSGLVE
jgi:hypothetical protein